MEIVDSNRNDVCFKQHCPFNWTGTMAIYLIWKAEKDPIEIARINLHGPTSQDDPNPVPSFEACIERAKEVMDWNWHPAGTKTARRQNARASFRYQMSAARLSLRKQTELRDGVVYMPTQGPVFGVYAVECNAMVVRKNGAGIEDIKIAFDYRVLPCRRRSRRDYGFCLGNRSAPIS